MRCLALKKGAVLSTSTVMTGIGLMLQISLLDREELVRPSAERYPKPLLLPAARGRYYRSRTDSTIGGVGDG
jgi:hypothetical protein